MIPEQRVFLLANLDGAAAILRIRSVPSPRNTQCRTDLRNQHAIANPNAHGHALALLVQRARPHGQDLRLVELLHARLRQDDAARGLGLGFDALH